MTRTRAIALTITDGVPVLVAEARTAEPHGTAVVLHDIFGLSDYIEDVLGALAGAGWHAVAPALFHRSDVTVVDYSEFERGLELTAPLSAASVLDDHDAAVRSAPTPSRRTAVMGFCLGGSLASHVAAHRDVASCVSFYGAPTHGEGVDIPPFVEVIDRLGAPWLGIFGQDDPLIPQAEVRQLESRLTGTDAGRGVLVLPGGHAFHRHTTPEYHHPESAARAWRVALGWIAP
ncbi:dienelactone hydrolase family protein [Pseudonocardia kujensis]|uniref:dienelactone hydrolase family protein n=1 Tax=Pseudonocardia kujensis TaxID=1128675 RepID=UPI001E4D5E5F|nr:dienelactone hydrolase family protein [Pseudonocardia kujensis]MCE0764928.1 dienelactone hydrolase family protein [Pseudonocardia kujensis]